jgi:callose synthase
LFSGLLSALFAGFLTYTYLEPLFSPTGSETALVFLGILAINGSLVGLALGVLLPLILPGVCFAGAAVLLAGSFAAVSNTLYFPVACGVLSLAFASLSSR